MEYGICFGTGMSATTALAFALLRPGDEIVLSDVVYGGTRRLVDDILQPFDIMRIRRQSETAQSVARWLEEQSCVNQVFYPGLPSHPQHELALSQQRSGDAMIAFELKGDFADAKELMAEVSLITLAENLGAAESIITHPASMTHGSMHEDERRRLGISPGLVRLSVGLEDADDLIRDLLDSLKKVVKS